MRKIGGASAALRSTKPVTERCAVGPGVQEGGLVLSWAAAMAAVRDYGTALVDDPARLANVTALGCEFRIS